MSVISDKLKSVVQSVFDLPKKDIERKVDIIVKNTRQGGEQGEQIKKILNQIETAEKQIETIQDTVKTVNAVLKSLKAARQAAQATEKASTISASLNPAAAAVAVAQKLVVDKVKKEEEEAQNVLNVTPSLVENFRNFISETKVKLNKVKKERERKKALREQRNRKLNS
tara:strand:+ start:1406 stop:1912 length:507 start_codon:yes stop_codon:yes gene_type:complete